MRSLALLGVSGSGKTTWLGSMARAIRMRQAQRFREAQRTDDSSLVDALINPLLESKYPDHTSTDARVRDARLQLKTADDLPEATFELEWSDYSGEHITTLFDKRTGGWTEHWERRAQADAWLLTVRLPPVGLPRPRLRQSTPTRSRRGIFGPMLTVDTGPEAPPLRSSEPVPPPTQLALIELLQFMRRARGLAPGERPAAGTLRVAVMITAWDALQTPWQAMGPKPLLVQETPLLADFLWSNFRADDVFRFGISATSGDLTQAVDKERYADNPRATLVWHTASGLKTSHDPSAPLAWALFGDDALP